VNNRQLARVGLGLLGIWAMLTATTLFIQIAGVVGGALAPLVLAEIIPVALLLGLSYLLIFHNARVASAIFPDVQDANTGVPSDLARTLVALTGVLILVGAAPVVVNAALTLLTLNDAEPTARGEVLRRLAGSAIPVGAGIYLIMHPSKFLDFLDPPTAESATESE
jgi:hypothetical protein